MIPAAVIEPLAAQGLGRDWPKGGLKRAARLAARVSVLHHFIWHRLAGRLGSADRAVQNLSQRAACWPGLWGAYRRVELLRLAGLAIAADCSIQFGTLISKASAAVGAGAYVGAYCCLGDVRIGRKTMLGDAVHVPSGAAQHGCNRLDVPMADQGGNYQTVTIGQDCWIGSGAIVLADVGDGAIVAAGATVTRPVAPRTVVAGVPARPIGRRTPDGVIPISQAGSLP